MELVQLILVTSDEQGTPVRQLFLEYAQWLHENINREYGVSFDVNAVLELFMAKIADFYPPGGRMYLSQCTGEIVGIGCLKHLDSDIGEIKRMFVRSEYRRKGIGEALLDRLITEARSIGYTKLRLDSPKLSTAAHGLYRSRGFQPIEPYPGSEGAEAQADIFVYMELVL